MTKIFCFLILALLGSCSITPLNSTTNGRTYGAGQTQFEAGNVASNYFFKYTTGLMDDFDLGYFMEFGSFTSTGIFMKYSIFNNPQGYAGALTFHYGADEGSKFSSFGYVNSFNFGNGIELFLDTRYSEVKTDENNFTLNEPTGIFTLKSFYANYLYYSYGLNFWATPQMGFSLYVVNITGSNIKTVNGTFGGQLLLNF